MPAARVPKAVRDEVRELFQQPRAKAALGHATNNITKAVSKAINRSVNDLRHEFGVQNALLSSVTRRVVTLEQTLAAMPKPTGPLVPQFDMVPNCPFPVPRMPGDVLFQMPLHAGMPGDVQNPIMKTKMPCGPHAVQVKPPPMMKAPGIVLPPPSGAAQVVFGMPKPSPPPPARAARPREDDDVVTTIMTTGAQITVSQKRRRIQAEDSDSH